MINRLSFVKMFNCWWRKIKEICSSRPLFVPVICTDSAGLDSFFKTYFFVFLAVSQSCPFIAAGASLLCHSPGVRGGGVSCEKWCQHSSLILWPSPSVKIVHVLLWSAERSRAVSVRSAVRSREHEHGERLQETGSGIMKVIAVVVLQGDEIPEKAEEGKVCVVSIRVGKCYCDPHVPCRFPFVEVSEKFNEYSGVSMSLF